MTGAVITAGRGSGSSGSGGGGGGGSGSDVVSEITPVG